MQLGDMMQIAQEIKSKKIKLPAIDICSFSTPCQGLSQAHNFGSKPTIYSEDLFKEIPNIVEAMEPKCITIEQVRPVSKTVHLYDQIVEKLVHLGYHVQARLVNTALYGSYTARVRWILIADKLDVHVVLPAPRTSFPGCKEILVDPARVPTHYRYDGPWMRTKSNTGKPPYFQSNLIGAIKKGGKGNRIYSMGHPAPTLTCSGSGWAGHGELILDEYGPRRWLAEELMKMHNITPTVV
jgi:site-specific DNA-cytosine methylase